jgi:hypothetical protein
MLDPDNAGQMADLGAILKNTRETGYINGRASRLPLVAAAQSILSYATMEEFLAKANDADAFGITARDLRNLRAALVS